MRVVAFLIIGSKNLVIDQHVTQGQGTCYIPVNLRIQIYVCRLIAEICERAVQQALERSLCIFDVLPHEEPSAEFDELINPQLELIPDLDWFSVIFPRPKMEDSLYTPTT